MKIQGDINFQYIFNVYNKKNKTIEDRAKIDKARKENPQLDRMLYQHDMNKMYEEQAEIERIVKKIARGERLTEEEKELINRVDPEILRKAEEAKQASESLKNKLRNAKSKQEAQKILVQTSMKVQQIAEGDPQYGNLLMELVKETYEDYNKDFEFTGETQQYHQNQQNQGNPNALIDFEC
ncbi:hypothetical protein [Clostridium sp. Marseille-QA1073]